VLAETNAAVDRVPFMDLARDHALIGPQLRDAFERVTSTSAFILGEEVERFEREFADYCGVEHCVGVASGTAALTLALKALGVRPGDEVIVPAHTFVASAFSVLHAGATPVFCDVEPGNGLIDAQSAADVISDHTVAIIAVHIYGQPCDMARLEQLAGRHGLAIVEDAAQAHGAAWGERRTGSLGSVAAFSFYPSKNLGALGDGGAICTSDPAIARNARRLRSLGQEGKGDHAVAGYNERLDGMQAAFLRVKLQQLDRWNASRRRHGECYRRDLPTSVETIEDDDRAPSVQHVFATRLADRDGVRARLDAHGIATGIHYDRAVHQQPPFAAHPRRTGLTEAERWAAEELSLPMFPTLHEHERDRVVEAVATVLEENWR
jgi:dTDP-4-amino-4,6-dideoxygalactose transaminase